MRLKDLLSPAFFIVLGFAFLAVSVWVWLGKGENAKAIKAKYKLGGMILSLSFFTASCDSGGTVPPDVTCYMIAQSTVIIPDELNKDTLTNGDTLFVQIVNPNFSYYSYSISDSTKATIFQNGMLQKAIDSSCHIIPINKTFNYSGKILVEFYGEKENQIKKYQFITSRNTLFISLK